VARSAVAQAWVGVRCGKHTPHERDEMVARQIVAKLVSSLPICAGGRQCHNPFEFCSGFPLVSHGYWIVVCAQRHVPPELWLIATVASRSWCGMFCLSYGRRLLRARPFLAMWKWLCSWGDAYRTFGSRFGEG